MLPPRPPLPHRTAFLLREYSQTMASTCRVAKVAGAGEVWDPGNPPRPAAPLRLSSTSHPGAQRASPQQCRLSHSTSFPGFRHTWNKTHSPPSSTPTGLCGPQTCHTGSCPRAFALAACPCPEHSEQALYTTGSSQSLSPRTVKPPLPGGRAATQPPFVQPAPASAPSDAGALSPSLAGREPGAGGGSQEPGAVRR